MQSEIKKSKIDMKKQESETQIVHRKIDGNADFRNNFIVQLCNSTTLNSQLPLTKK